MTTYCAHSDAVPVKSVVDDETVAALCPDCGADLPEAWLTCAHQETIDISSLGERHGRTLCNGCGATYWPGAGKAQANPPEPTGDEWAVGDRVTVRPITIRVNDGPPRSGYLVVRDPDGDARISAVTYDDDPPARTATLATGGYMSSPAWTRAWMDPQTDCLSRLTQGWPQIEPPAGPAEGGE